MKLQDWSYFESDPYKCPLKTARAHGMVFFPTGATERGCRIFDKDILKYKRYWIRMSKNVDIRWWRWREKEVNHRDTDLITARTGSITTHLFL